MQQDPIGYSAGDSNLYRYLYGNPVQATDPSGLQGDGDIVGSWILPLFGITTAPCYQLHADCNLTINVATAPGNSLKCRTLLSAVLPTTVNWKQSLDLSADLCSAFGCRCVI